MAALFNFRTAIISGGDIFIPELNLLKISLDKSFLRPVISASLKYCSLFVMVKICLYANKQLCVVVYFFWVNIDKYSLSLELIKKMSGIAGILGLKESALRSID